MIEEGSGLKARRENEGMKNALNTALFELMEMDERRDNTCKDRELTVKTLEVVAGVVFGAVRAVELGKTCG